MNQLQQVVILLLQSAVTQEKGVLPQNFDLSELLPVARAHHMAPLIYEGMALCGVLPNEPAMQKLFQSYCKAVMVSERQMAAFRSICEAFENNGIQYMPFKGCIMKELYPRAELRMMGDADILIRQEQYNEIMCIMEALGFQAQKESDQDYVWRSSSLYVELHKHLMPQTDKDFYSYFADSWRFAVVRTSENQYTMTPEDMFVFLFVHFAKHYRLSGVGCRHMLDLWIYLRANPQLNKEYVEEKLKKLHLLTFYFNIMRTLNVWFAEEVPNEMTDFITDTVFANGSWGTKEAATLSSIVNGAQATDGTAAGRVRYVLHRVFPGWEALCCEYPILRRTPVLAPLVWMYRIMNKLTTKRKLFQRHAHNLSVLTQENLDNRRQKLKYVGLEYRDKV